MTRLFALLCGAVLVAGCSADAEAVDSLQSALDEQRRTQQELAQRVDELEQVLAPDAADGEDPLSRMTTRLDTLQQALDDLRQGLRGERRARKDGDDAGASARSDLEGELAGIESALQEVRDELQLLREDLESVQVQLRNHRH